MHNIPSLIAMLSLLLFNSPAARQITWTPIGAGGGGWLSAITVVNDAAGTVYVGCDVGGIYKSTDHGATWEIKDTGLAIYYVQDIAYDPHNSTTLYAATRGGIYKSVDGGDHWVGKRAGFPTMEEFSFSAPVSDIVIDPDHPNILYAGVGIHRAGYALESYAWQSAGTKGAIYKSIDSGEHWSHSNTGIDPAAMIYSLAIDPAHSSTLYAATSTGIYKSTDSGQNWSGINTGLPQHLAMSLVINPDNSNTLYVTLWAEPGSNNWQGGVYKSTDGGENWIVKNNGLPARMDDERGLTSNYPQLVIDPDNPETLYLNSRPWWPDPGVFKTTNGGESWTWVSKTEPEAEKNINLGWITKHGPFARSLAVDPGNPGRLYLGTSTHLLTTINGGHTWNPVYTRDKGKGYWQGRGLESSVVQDITIDPENPTNIYAGYWDMGFLKSIDGGRSFKRTSTGMGEYSDNTFSIVVDPDDTKTIYAATGWWEENKGQVCVSHDYGETWTIISSGLPDAQVWSIALAPHSPQNNRILYATSYGHGVYKTVDGGVQWTFAGSGLGSSDNRQVRTITIDPNNSSILYAGLESRVVEDANGETTYQGGLYKSTNGGQSWTRMDTDMPQLNVWDIEVDPNNSQIIYSAVSGGYDHTLQETFYGGVYKSTDAGMHWTNNNNDFGAADNLNVTSVAISPADSTTLYAATSDAPYHDQSGGRGIFASHNAGLAWTPISDPAKVLYFDVITIDPSNPSLLYAGSGGNGILKGIVPIQ